MESQVKILNSGLILMKTFTHVFLVENSIPVCLVSRCRLSQTEVLSCHPLKYPPSSTFSATTPPGIGIVII